MIQAEACEVLTVGLGLFYPSPNIQTRLLSNLLTSASSAEPTQAEPQTDEEVDKIKGMSRNCLQKLIKIGWKKYLDALLVLLSRHPNPSFLLLPPSSQEIQVITVHKFFS